MNKQYWETFERFVEHDMKITKWSVTKLLATITKTISVCYFRPGKSISENDSLDSVDDDSEDDTHYGVTTLLNKHVRIDEQGNIHFEFIGKSGKTNVCTINLDEQSTLVKNLSYLKSKGHDEDPLFYYEKEKYKENLASQLRDYLKQHQIRPKDFRTFHANYILVDELKMTDALHLTGLERKRVVSGAIRKASKDLNNTPPVAKRSYIFNTLWVLYLVYPAEFMQILSDAKSQDTSDILSEFLKEIEKNPEKFDWKVMYEKYKENFGLLSFQGDLNVLIITEAGSMSLDLKGVNHIVLLEPTWTPAQEEQIIGRGQRFKSHEHLPKNKRFVNVWKLFLDYPEKEKRDLSAERKMELINKTKVEFINDFYKLLKSVSI